MNMYAHGIIGVSVVDRDSESLYFEYHMRRPRRGTACALLFLLNKTVCGTAGTGRLRPPRADRFSGRVAIKFVACVISLEMRSLRAFLS